MSNAIVKAKIEVYGLTSTVVVLGVADSSSITVDETLIGQNSGASCTVQSIINSTSIVIKNRDGFFDNIEPVVGSVSASTTTNGTSFQSQTYENNDLNVTAGTWTIDSSDDLLVTIDDSVKKIDISQGGNYATGYTFGFTLANLTVVKNLSEDGVFLQNLKVSYFIDFGSGYTSIWTGKIDTVPKSGAIEAKFTCIDAMKAKIETFGSDSVPIALNENQNCKLPLATENETIYTVPSQTGAGTVKYFYCYGANKTFNVDTILDSPIELQTVLFLIDNSSGWKTALDSGEQLSLRTSAGGDAGNIYNITSIENQGSDTPNYTYYRIGLDAPTDSIVGTSTGTPDLTLFQLVRFENRYNLSQNNVLSVFDSNTSSKKTLRSIDEKGVESYMTKGVNFNNTLKNVSVFGISDDGSIVAKDSTSVDYSGATFTESKTDGSTFTQIITNVTIDLNDLIRVSNSIDDLFLSIGKITFNTTFDSGTGYLDPNISCIVNAEGDYRNDIIDSDIFTVNFMSEALTTYGVKNGSNIELTPIIPNEFLKFSGFGDSKVYSSSFLRFTIVFAVQASSYSSEPIITGVNFEDLFYQTISPIDIGKLAIGCNGENLDSGRFESYPETIKYIQTEYAGFDIADINELSYTQAEEDYNLFPSYTDRNPAHQIIEQSSYNDILKDLLYFSHLGLFPDRFGKLTLVNWLPKSTVFSDTSPESSYTETEYSNITDIKRPTTIKVVSDFELQYDYSEAEGEYKSTIRIKNTDKPSFIRSRYPIWLPFPQAYECSERVPAEFEKEAEQAWELLRAGYNRVKKQSQFKVESKWIKRFYKNKSFIGGESEAINFIRNQAGHINREHERVSITLQLNQTDAIKELLSFDCVYHKKKTDDEVRKGWLVESRISWRSKTITFTYLLDISLKDPFLYRIGIIQDNATVDDIIENDQTSLDIIEDGGGI